MLRQDNYPLGLNLYDFHVRNFDPDIGRWLSVDPLAEQTFEPYSYVGNNPIMFIDPTGMSAEGGEHDPPGSQNPRKAEVRPEGMSEREALSHITEVDGKKYHKYTGNVFAKAANTINSWFGDDSDYFVEKKPYNPADNNFIHESFDTAAGTLFLGSVFGAGGKLLGKTSVSSTIDKATGKLMDQASKVLGALGKGSGPVYGTKAHTAFAKAVNGM